MQTKSSSVTADILNYVSDGKIHSMKQIADEIEVSERTVRRHIRSLAYRYPIETFCGGINRGGVFLDTKYIVQGKIITLEKLQILDKALILLQKSGCKDVNQKALNELIKDFTLPKRNKEDYFNYHEDQQKQAY